MNSLDARPPIHVARVHSMLAASGLDLPGLRVVDSTRDSTDLLHGLQLDLETVIAEAVTPSGVASGTALHTFTALEVSEVFDTESTWLPMIAALAASDAVHGVRAMLAWPSTLVIQAAACGGAKGYGVIGAVDLVATTPRIAIASLRINVDVSARDLPDRDATSLLSEGGDLDRTALLGRYLIALARRRQQWRDSPEAFRAEYAERCITIGRLTEDGRVVTGIDDSGALTLR